MSADLGQHGDRRGAAAPDVEDPHADADPAGPHGYLRQKHRGVERPSLGEEEPRIPRLLGAGGDVQYDVPPGLHRREADAERSVRSHRLSSLEVAPGRAAGAPGPAAWPPVHLVGRRAGAARVSGSDHHDASIGQARRRAAETGVGNRVTSELASAQSFTGLGYDLVTTFDCLHDVGAPLSAAPHVRGALAPTARGSSSNQPRPTPSRATLSRSGGSTTPSRRSCACRMRCPSRAATPSAPRRVRLPSARSRPTPASPGSATSAGHRSTTSTRPGHDAPGWTPVAAGRFGR
jgi:hypothetical protein